MAKNSKLLFLLAVLSLIVSLCLYNLNTSTIENHHEAHIKKSIVAYVKSGDELYINNILPEKLYGYCILGPYSVGSTDMTKYFSNEQIERANKKLGHYSRGPRSEFLVIFLEKDTLVTNFYNEPFSLTLTEQSYCRNDVTQPIPYISNIK